MALINEKIEKRQIPITFGELSIGDEIYKYVFEDERNLYRISGNICSIYHQNIDDSEYLAIHYTYTNSKGSKIRSQVFVYPNDYIICDKLSNCDVVYTSYKLPSGDLEKLYKSQEYRTSFVNKPCIS